MSLTSNESPQTAQSDQGPPRKKMRKGTRSCLECRRRKIKCTFEDGRPAICNECHARGSTCIDQEHGDIQTYAQSAAVDPSYSLRERVTQLEDLVRQVLHNLPEKETVEGSGNGLHSSPDDTSCIDTQAAEVLKSLRHKPATTYLEESIPLLGGFREEAPALTLFDNAVISRQDAPQAITRAQYNKSKALVSALNQLLPSPHDLDIILDASADWWVIWRKMFPEIADTRCLTIKESVSHSLRSENPAEVAKTMLCIANSIYQMPVSFDWNQLKMREDPRDLMERYITTVEKLIISDDEIAATVDGIECMVLSSKYHINMGRPRRAWLLFHRAIAFGQLLGLHRLSSRKPAKDDHQYTRQVSLWCHLFAGDKFLALVLGLPYTVSDQFCTPYIPGPGERPADALDGETYLARMIPLISRMIDRNQSPTPMPYSATLRIDQDLEELHDTQPATWWTLDRFEGASIDEHFDRLQAQFYHHQCRVVLHMPFMLKSSADKRYQYSHSAALDSAREMIRYYEALREDDKCAPYLCKIIDFQAFTAATLLLLNLCGYSQHVRGAVTMQPDLDRDQQDSALIDRTISMLHDASKEAGGIVAAQSAKALQMLAMARHGCCDEQGMTPQPPEDRCTISIPYFGTVTIAMGKHFVPIKEGTYARPGEPRKLSMPPAQPAAAGLPTPPSLASHSTQPSPMSSTLDRPFGSTDWIAPGLGNTDVNYGDLITFDSFMALPPQQDFCANDGTGTGTGTAFTSLPYPPNGGSMNFDPTISATGGFPFGGNGNVDLDHGWNWFGVDGAPSMS